MSRFFSWAWAKIRCRSRGTGRCSYSTSVAFSCFAISFGLPMVADKKMNCASGRLGPQPGYGAVQPVPPLLVLEHVHLVDDHGADLLQRRRPRLAAARSPAPRRCRRRCPSPATRSSSGYSARCGRCPRGCRLFPAAVAALELLVLLVGQRHQRH